MLEVISPAALSGKIQTPSQARKAAEEFEGMFLSTLLETMFSGLETDGPFGGGNSEEMYRSMMVQEYGKAITASGGIGISDVLERQLLSLQEI
ncbi:MAG: rod-binding protein [Pseudomonadota bacterium]